MLKFKQLNDMKPGIFEQAVIDSKKNNSLKENTILSIEEQENLLGELKQLCKLLKDKWRE